MANDPMGELIRYEPTPEIHHVRSADGTMRLQQKWRAPNTDPRGHVSAWIYEWRDVPVVDENGELVKAA